MSGAPSIARLVIPAGLLPSDARRSGLREPAAQPERQPVANLESAIAAFSNYGCMVSGGRGASVVTVLHGPAWVYEPARAAYQRLMDAGVLDCRQRRKLRDRYESLNPFALKRELERGLKPILARAVDERRRPAGGGATPVGLRSTARRAILHPEELTATESSQKQQNTCVMHLCLRRILGCHLSMSQRG